MHTCPVGADGVILEVLERLGVKYILSVFTAAYLAGKLTQILASLETETPCHFNQYLYVGHVNKSMHELNKVFLAVANALNIKT